jgi:hypothetical protein
MSLTVSFNVAFHGSIISFMLHLYAPAGFLSTHQLCVWVMFLVWFDGFIVNGVSFYLYAHVYQW